MALRALSIWDTTFLGIFAQQGIPGSPGQSSYGFWGITGDVSSVFSQDRVHHFVTLQIYETMFPPPFYEEPRFVQFNRLTSAGQEVDIKEVTGTKGEGDNYFPVGNMTYTPTPPGI